MADVTIEQMKQTIMKAMIGILEEDNGQSDEEREVDKLYIEQMKNGDWSYCERTRFPTDEYIKEEYEYIIKNGTTSFDYY